jgi:hypothetical protein
MFHSVSPDDGNNATGNGLPAGHTAELRYSWDKEMNNIYPTILSPLRFGNGPNDLDDYSQGVVGNN